MIPQDGEGGDENEEDLANGEDNAGQNISAEEANT
jgi:hypothetical protein